MSYFHQREPGNASLFLPFYPRTLIPANINKDRETNCSMDVMIEFMLRISVSHNNNKVACLKKKSPTESLDRV
jgi:hypothetical protein